MKKFNLHETEMSKALKALLRTKHIGEYLSENDPKVLEQAINAVSNFRTAYFKEISDKDIQNAIEVRCSECFIAMLYANALAGSPSISWNLIRTHELPELLTEAKHRGLPIGNWYAAVDTQKRKVIETPAYLSAIATFKT